jgi:hypothetical protein
MLLTVCLLMSSGLALTPRFNPRDLVRQMRSGDSKPLSDGCKQLPDSGEFLIDTNNTLTPAQSYQGSPAIAFDGKNFLVVWDDFRSGSSLDIYGARVTPSGVVLDSAGFPITIALRDQAEPALAFDGDNFLVIWRQDERVGLDQFDICGTRVTPAGVVLDSVDIAISTALNTQAHPALAFDGANFLAVWQDYRSGSYDMYGARLTPAGTVLDTSGIPISTAANWQTYPAIAFDGADFLVVWDDNRSDPNDHDVYGARVTPAGAVLNPTGVAVSAAAGDQAGRALAFDGTNFLVAWQDRRDTTLDIYGARVTPSGIVLDSVGIPIATAPGDQAAPALAFDGTNFLVVWSDDSSGSYADIYGTRVTPDGVVLDSTGVAISTAEYSQGEPVLAFDGENILAVWGDSRNYDYTDIYGARVTPASVVLDSLGIAISTAAYSQYEPALAFDGANFLAVWEDYRSGSYEIYGARLTPSGAVLDSVGIAISTVANTPQHTAVAFDGADFLVVWDERRGYPRERDIYGTRVTPTGVVLDPDGIAISAAGYSQFEPAIAFDGTNFLVVWEDWGISSRFRICGTRVTPAGEVLDPARIVISPETKSAEFPALAFDGENYLVAWCRGDIYGARVTPSGAVLDSAGFAISTAPNNQEYPVLTFDGTNYLVVWQDRRSGVDIYGARVTPAGAVLDSTGIAISTAANAQEYPALVFDGDNYLVVWEDYRNGSYDLYGARVTPVGSVFDSSAVIRQEGVQLYPALARGPANRISLVYEGWTGTVGGKPYNTQRIWGKKNLSGGAEERVMNQASRRRAGATVVHGVLDLRSGDYNLQSEIVLLSADGRKVLDLHPGANDVRALAPGVYFVREAPAQAQARVVRKVVLTE